MMKTLLIVAIIIVFVVLFIIVWFLINTMRRSTSSFSRTDQIQNRSLAQQDRLGAIITKDEARQQRLDGLVDKVDKERLKNIYMEKMPEDELIEMAMQDPSEYQEGIYDLVMEAIQQRGLSSKLDILKKEAASGGTDKKWVEIFSYSSEMEGSYLEDLLKRSNIPVENILLESGRFDPLPSQPQGAGVLRVEEGFEAEAGELISDFLNKNASDYYLLSDVQILEAVSKVLEKRHLADHEQIAQEILASLKDQA